MLAKDNYVNKSRKFIVGKIKEIKCDKLTICCCFFATYCALSLIYYLNVT